MRDKIENIADTLLLFTFFYNNTIAEVHLILQSDELIYNLILLKFILF